VGEMTEIEHEFIQVNRRIDSISKKLETIKTGIYYLENKIPCGVFGRTVKKFNKETQKMDEITERTFQLLLSDLPFAKMIHGKKFVLLMSGTPQTELLTSKPVITVNSIHPIKVENRPLIFVDEIGSMSYNSRDMTAKKMAPIIVQLYKKHGCKSLMTHVGSYPVARIIYNEMVKYMDKNKIILQSKELRNESMNQFKNERGFIYLAVEMNEGIDLAGPDYEAQVVAKLPADPWMDEYVVARNAYDKDHYHFNRWYDYRSAAKLMQSYGRICRTPTDYGITYVLDKAVHQFWNRNRTRLFYEWFNTAIQVKSLTDVLNH